jgi:hypothetical protein
MDEVEEIEYAVFLDTCNANGLTYGVYTYHRKYWLCSSYSIFPCRGIDEGRKLISELKADGWDGYFFIRPLPLSDDGLITRLGKWLTRYVG